MLEATKFFLMIIGGQKGKGAKRGKKDKKDKKEVEN